MSCSICIICSVSQVSEKDLFTFTSETCFYHIIIFITIHWSRVSGRTFTCWTIDFTIAAFFRKDNRFKNILYNTLLSNLVCPGRNGSVLIFRLNVLPRFSFLLLGISYNSLETFIKSIPWPTCFTILYFFIHIIPL